MIDPDHCPICYALTLDTIIQVEIATVLYEQELFC